MAHARSVLPVREPDSTAAPSDYADQMLLLYELASLPEGDPRRAELRERLICAFLPVVEHLARLGYLIPCVRGEMLR